MAAEASREILQASQRPTPEHSKFSNAWILQRIATAEAMKPGPAFDAFTKALLIRLWSRTLDEIGPERFDEAFLSVLESSRFRPDIAEIRERAGLVSTPPLKAIAEIELRKVIEAMRLHGPKLKLLLGPVIRDRDEDGRVLMRPERGPIVPAPVFSPRTEQAILELGFGDRLCGLEMITGHRALDAQSKDEPRSQSFAMRDSEKIEERWMQCYVRCT